MTRKALLSQSELKKMAGVAKEQDVCIEVEIDGVLIRVMPSGKHRQVQEKPTREDQADEALRAWKASRRTSISRE